jgi:hypothetical protein
VPNGHYLRPEEYQDELGNDVTLIDEFLAKTPAERLAAWESFANGILELRAMHVPTHLPPVEPAPPRR